MLSLVAWQITGGSNYFLGEGFFHHILYSLSNFEYDAFTSMITSLNQLDFAKAKWPCMQVTVCDIAIRRLLFVDDVNKMRRLFSVNWYVHT